MKTFALFYLVSWLLRSSMGRILLLGALLWYLDHRYVGLVATLLAPVGRMRRIGALKTSVATNPTDIRAMLELAEHYLRAGRPQVALQYVEQAFDRGEDSARALFVHGAALVELQQYEAGRAKLEAALAQAPDVGFGEPYLYLLQEALAIGSDRVERIVDQLERYDSVEVLARAGQLLARAGKMELARPLFEAALQNYGYTPKGMRRRARRWAFRARLALLLGK